MHNEACRRVSAELVEAKLNSEISGLKSLTAGASAAGARVHNLPERPKDIEDDGEFHYAVLGPKAASTAGNPSVEAKRFIEETTGSDRPRVYRNAVVLAVPSRDGLEMARDRIREYLGWEEVRNILKGQAIDPLRTELLNAYVDGAKKKIIDAVRQAYCLAVTVSDKNEILAYKLTVGTDPLFNIIKADERVRIQETAVSAEALLPEGPYNLWREGETARRVKDLVGAFAQFPHLPKMLRRKEILETLVQGVREGLFVLRAVRPDRSVRTIWRQEPLETDLKDPGLELVLPEAASLTEIPPDLLIPRVLPGLWPAPEISVSDVIIYFSGGNVVKVSKGIYEEPVTIPKAQREVVEAAVSAVVREGKLWLTSGVASILGEEIPAGIFTDDAVLQAPPHPIPVTNVLPENLPDAWKESESTVLGIAVALSKKVGKTLPWTTIREAVDGAIKTRLLEKTIDSGPWPCDYSGAQNVKVRVPESVSIPPLPPPPVTPRKPGSKVAEAELRPNEIQDLAEIIGELVGAAVGYELTFHLRVELSGEISLPDDVVDRVNQLLEEVTDELKLE
jgi:hypothetical protein